MKTIQKATFSQLSQIQEIYETAKNFMRSTGNMTQWTNGYPSQSLIEQDIASGICYTCMDNDEIVGVFIYFQAQDPTYKKIYQGKWLNSAPYGVIHRIATACQARGAGSFCMNWAFEQCHNLKMDTHRDNKVMQNALSKNGFKYCGIIYLEDGDERLAYQKS